MADNTARQINIKLTKRLDIELKHLMELLGENQSSTIHRAITALHTRLIRNTENKNHE